jgi:hypothetical protein
MENNFKIVSYYTYNTPYEEIAEKYLLASIKKQNIQSYDVRGIYNQGSWLKNTSYKPTFIKSMMQHYPNENILFLDADAEILEDIHHMFSAIPDEYNIACHILSWAKWYGYTNDKTEELLTGTLWLRNCSRIHQILELWIDRCKRDPKAWEQKILEKILKDVREPIYNIDVSYCYINELPNHRPPIQKVDKIHILHHQSSREYKKRIVPDDSSRR